MVVEFVASTLGVSYLIGSVAMRLWKKDSRQWQVFPAFYTFLPALIGIAVNYIYTKEWSLGDFSFTKFPPGYMALGLALPIAFFALSLVVQALASSYKVIPGADWKKVLPSIPVTILVLIVFVSGEEIGWRGFLQTSLIDRFGVLGGVVLLGLIWGIWHAPVALRGHNLSDHFWAEAFVLYPFMCVCYSFPLAYLTIQSGSIWPALIFHATNNALGSAGAQIIEKKNDWREIALLMLTGLALAIPFGLLLAGVV
jgi:membrane protease YdiL (CAAX protease family)